MTHLIEKVGREYFNRRFSGSFFMDDRKRPSIVGRAADGMVNYTAITGSPRKIIRTARDLPYSFFSGLEVFGVPPLGWRSHSEGKYLAFYTRNNRSYHRGLSPDNIQVHPTAMTQWMLSSNNLTTSQDPETLCFVALKPHFTPFAEGIQKMREGSLLSFAVSPTVAVVPTEDDKFSILFRQAKAGVVMPDNSVIVDVPLLSDYMGATK